MSNSKEKALNFLASLAKEHGIEFNKQEHVENGALLPDNSRITNRENLQGVARTLHYPHEFRLIKCIYCGEVFKTNSCQMSYCEESCLIKDLKDRFGIIWTVEKRNANLKGYEKPLVVDSKITRQLYDWAKEFIQAYEYLDGINDNPKNNPKRVREQRVRYTPSGESVVEYAEISSQEFPLPEVFKTSKTNHQASEVLVKSQTPEPRQETFQSSHTPSLDTLLEKYQTPRKDSLPSQTKVNDFESLFAGITDKD